jgi:hypothetical protein
MLALHARLSLNDGSIDLEHRAYAVGRVRWLRFQATTPRLKQYLQESLVRT